MDLTPNVIGRQRWPTTHWSLISRAGAGGGEEQRQAIESLVKTYLPVLRWHLLAGRIVARDRVDDLLQEFLVWKILERGILKMADREKGRFRTFLAISLDRFAINRSKSRRAEGGGTVELDQLEDDSTLLQDAPDPADAFNLAWARQVLGQAVRQLKLDCVKQNRQDVWGVFRGRILSPVLRNVEPEPYKKLVEEFGLESAGDVPAIVEG
jgi:DNA-directed RNA polymerase specialized sigma24 family protein